MLNQPVASRLEMSPARFYALTSAMGAIGAMERGAMEDAERLAYDLLVKVEGQVLDLARTCNSFEHEVRLATRRKRDPFEAEDERLEELQHTAGGGTFIRVAYGVLSMMHDEVGKLHGLIQDLVPSELILTKRKHKPEDIEDISALQHMVFELQLNKPALDRFVSAIARLDGCRASVYDCAVGIERIFDSYYKRLLDRHSVQGIEIHGDPILTDVAMSVYENVDAHGEVADGKNPNELSAYSVRKAMIIADAVKAGPVRDLVNDPKSLTGRVAEHLKNMWLVCDAMTRAYGPITKRVLEASDVKRRHSKAVDLNDFMTVAEGIEEDLDLRAVAYKEKAVLLTAEERFNLGFRNKTLRELVKLIQARSAGPKDLVDYVLARKEEMRNYFRDENSFYVCRIGSGNPFLGEAPGSLSVVPGIRPNVNLDEILGSGFAEIKDFIGTIEASSRFADLFMATSPSKSTDKANVLLVGPQGCGKSEILRAVGGDKKSIGVFAQGSDFLTCWKGEAEKNPKRLFESGMKLQKESRKHVHFLIDEIDSVLNSDREFGATNLTLEFQILMDGVVHYPHLSVWGATNSPERIPMPMIRRFNKVAIVGELSQEDRVKLLKQFVDYMPCGNIPEEDWQAFATKLDGATGDVIRKVVDHVWRVKMTWFTENHRPEAERLVDELNKGEKFQIANFDAKRRAEFKKLLSEYMSVSARDLDSSISSHLQNIAVHNEIETAKATYERAKAFLAQIKAGEV